MGAGILTSVKKYLQSLVFWGVDFVLLRGSKKSLKGGAS